MCAHSWTQSQTRHMRMLMDEMKGLTTSSLREPSSCSPCNRWAGGRNWMRISALRSFKALPALSMKGVVCHLPSKATLECDCATAHCALRCMHASLLICSLPACVMYSPYEFWKVLQSYIGQLKTKSSLQTYMFKIALGSPDQIDRAYEKLPDGQPLRST